MDIDVYCTPGSPTGVIPMDIHGRGVGGAEYALLTWAPQMAKRGHTVRVYNDPRVVGAHEGVQFLPRQMFRARTERDAFIAFRGSGAVALKNVRLAPKQVFWSCDQYTNGDYDVDMFPFVDHVVTISPFHTEYFKKRYNVSRFVEAGAIGHIDLGVRTWEYDQRVEKVPYQAIYCSVPDRGLEQMVAIWPEVKERVPKATLVITADYRLWGVKEPNDGDHRARLAHLPGVRYLGMVPRSDLVRLQLESEIMLYPCVYDELFCIACAECQVAGAYPVTTSQGALTTTNAFGTRVTLDALGIIAANALSGRFTLSVDVLELRKKATRRFHWDRICDEWEKVLV